MRYDVIVVGAGPAGSTAARVCAARGMSVLLLDKAEFPREKPCGGGVNVRTTRLLPFDLAPVAERAIYGARFSVRQGRSFTRTSTEPLTFMTQRLRLDAFLVERALESGAILREGSAVRAVERHAAHVVVRAGGAVYEGRTLVAADGVNGRAARMAGVQVRHWLLVALEGNVRRDGGVPVEWERLVGLDADAVPGSYGWIFPKGDHLNVGVGGWQKHAPGFRERLDTLARYYGFDPNAYEGLRGYRLPIRRPGAPLVDGNVALAGDAAGLVDFWTGEGIYSAVWSGKALAAHLAAFVGGTESDLRGYERQVQNELLPELHLSRRLYDLFHLNPVIGLGVIERVPSVWPWLCAVLRGDSPYAYAREALGPLSPLLDLASDVARLTPRWAAIVCGKDAPRPTSLLRRERAAAGAR